MNTDIRLSVFFFQHRKTKKLKRKLGAEGVLALISLWTYAAVNHPEGILPLDEEDIAIAADWDGDPEEFVSALIEIGFLEKLEDGTYKIHDWEEHQPWVVGARERKEKARKAAKSKWEKMSEEEKEEHARKMAEARWGGNKETNSMLAKCLQDACNPQAECLQDACSMLADACVDACPFPFLTSPYLSSPNKKEEALEKECSANALHVGKTDALPTCDEVSQNSPPLETETSQNLPPLSKNDTQLQKQAPPEKKAEPENSAFAKKEIEPGTPENLVEPEEEKSESVKTKGKPRKPTEGGLPNCPCDEIVSLYHEILPELPKVKVLNGTRKSYLRTRWREVLVRPELLNMFVSPEEVLQKPLKEVGLLWFRRYFEYVRESDFLCGRTEPTKGRNTPFQADFEWLIRPTNFVKVLEGRYHRRNRESPLSQLSPKARRSAIAAMHLLEELKQEEEGRRNVVH